MNPTMKTIHSLAFRRIDFSFDKIDYRYTKVSPRRMRNWFLAELGYRLKWSRVRALPTHLQIEPINICNLRCPLCHVVTDSKSRGQMELSNYKRLIDEVAQDILFLHFWGWGEPFLNDDIYEMFHYAKERGLKIITSTNGHFFESTRNVDRLIDSGVDVLIFALDGTDPATYEKYRHNGDFQKVTRSLKELVRRKGERKSMFPRINLRMLITRENENQVEDMKQLGADIGVDVFTLKTLCSFDNKPVWETMVPENPEFRRFRYDSTGTPIRITNPCKKPWNHPTVYRDGSVVPCDYYTGEEFTLGNVFSEDGRGFHRVWFGKAFERFRRDFLSGDRAKYRCADCSLNYAPVDRCVSHAFIPSL
jgi:radical SAM protein with 4Fe4S-binding SPASM domain